MKLHHKINRLRTVVGKWHNIPISRVVEKRMKYLWPMVGYLWQVKQKENDEHRYRTDYPITKKEGAISLICSGNVHYKPAQLR